MDKSVLKIAVIAGGNSKKPTNTRAWHGGTTLARQAADSVRPPQGTPRWPNKGGNGVRAGLKCPPFEEF